MRKHRQNYNANGRTRRKGGVGNPEASVRKDHGDPFHNGQIPLCQLLSDVIEDIFPELQDQGSPNRGSQSQQHARPELGSTLGRMIRRRYLLSRKSARASLDAKFKNDKLDEEAAWDFTPNNNNINLQKNTTNNNPPASTTTKKRRKRKKKKRQEPDDSFIPSVISHNSNGNDFQSEPCSRSGIDRHTMSDGKSMMSHTDHSLEALDEALKTEAEKLIELQANHEMPMLASFPSDDDMQGHESPSQFIDQIKPEDEHLLQSLPDHMDSLPLTNGPEVTTLLPLLEVDNIPENDDSLELKYNNPLELSFLVNFEGGKENDRRDGSLCEVPKNLMNVASDKERGRIILNEWIDQFFFANDECECIETSVATSADKDNCDGQKDEWDSFLQFCNDRTVGKEKALGISLEELLDIGSSIGCRMCRDETLAELNKIAGNEYSSAAAKPSRIVMKPEIVEKPSAATEDINIDAAFDYIAMEEGNHIPNDGNVEQEEEKSDSTISFLAKDVAIDPKQKKSANKNGNKKKNVTGSVSTMERYLYLEPLTAKQLEEFLSEWLIAGVDEEKLVQTCVRNDTGPDSDGKAAFPVVTTEDELQRIKDGVVDLQISLKASLDDMNMNLEKMRSEWRSKDASKSTEMNLDFSGNETMENCEETFHGYLTDDVLTILTGDFSLPSHACPELQVHLWAMYLEGLGKTLKSCDVYYKKLDEDLADQNGKLPFIFTSAPFRKIYRELAEEKLEFLSELGKTFSSALSSCSMKEFYTRSSWENQDDHDIDSQKLDEDCRELIIELTDWARIINGGRMSAINKTRSKGLLRVFNLLRVVVESLGTEYKMVERYFSKERQDYFSRLLSSIHLAHGVKHQMRLIEMDDVISLTTGVILMWRHVRIMQSRVDRTISTEMLPLSLRKWVLESPSIDMKPDESYQFSPDLVHAKCWPGIGARRRVMGILAGLTYAWFRERCKEWKAEKASQELLTYFETDLLAATDPEIANASKSSISKSNKKSKKKKNKKSSSNMNPASSRNENNDEIKTNIDSLPEEQEGLEDDLGNKVTEVAEDNTEGPVEFDVNSVDHDTKINSSKEEEKDDTGCTDETTETVDGGNDVEFLYAEKEDNNPIEYYESSVVVQDESGCAIPAMEFLTDRLVQLLKQQENEQVVIVSS